MFLTKASDILDNTPFLYSLKLSSIISAARLDSLLPSSPGNAGLFTLPLN